MGRRRDQFGPEGPEVSTSAACRSLRFQKQSTLALWYRARTADSRIGTRKTMIVALARKLVIALWRFVTTGEPANPGLGSPGFLDRTLNLGG
jgi:hypothetical protein